MKVSDQKKAAIFKALASKSLRQVAVDFELTDKYSSLDSATAAVQRIYNQVKNNPEEFIVSPDTVELVVSSVSNRTAGRPVIHENINEKDIKDLVTSGRDKVARIINRKLDYVERSPKLIKELSFAQLGTIFGILFDKSQIVQGQATEHILKISKIDSNMSADQALDTVLRMREQQ